MKFLIVDIFPASFLLGLDIFLGTFLQTPAVDELPLLFETNSHTHTTQAGKILVWKLYLNFTFLDRRRKDKMFWT
jgi:hypothetical protein